MTTLRSLLFFGFCAEAFTNQSISDCDVRTSRALLQIFTQCKKNHDTIIINDDAQQLSLPWLQKLHNQFHSVILHNQKCKYLKNISNKKKVDNIVITLSSRRKLFKILKSRYRTSWWDAMTPVYLLYLPQNNCNVVMEIFEIMWQFMILTSYFLCIEFDEVRIYTYNPFSNRAPSNWTEIPLSTPTKTHWTLFELQYHTQTTCQGLDFDRTEHLDGYPINVVAPIANRKYYSFEGMFINYNNLSHYGTITEAQYHFIMDALAKKLNIRLHIYGVKKIFYDEEKDLTYTKYVMNVSRKIRAKLVITNYHLSEKMRFGGGNFMRGYPLAWYENRIATYNRGYKTLVEKLIDFYGFWTILFTIFVLVITFVVILCFENKGIAFAVFEVIRLLICHSLYTKMNTLPLRIFFLSIFIYFLIIQATFSGHLVELLTKPELRKHPETKEDVKDLGYTIFDLRYVQENLAKTEEEKIRYKYIVKICLNHILYNDSSVACILNYKKLFEFSQTEKTTSFYISKRPLETLYQTLLVKNFWSLFNRVNLVIMSLEELGFRHLMSSNETWKLTHTLIITEARSKHDFQPIKLENLIFSFWILIVGLFSAVLSFCVEMFISNRSK